MPSDVVLKTVIACEPPPLPTPHLSRQSIFPDLARKFDSHRVVAVTGYPESGKTTAMAEFAAVSPGSVFWFSMARSETHPDAWLGLLCFSLAQYLGASSLLPSNIRSELLDRRDAILLVIDNAQHCPDLDSLSFLIEAAQATRAISVLLVGVDEPSFVSAVRSRGIVDWRLPGLTAQEARALAELTGGKLSSHQLNALEILRVRVDGHLGMLKLCQATLRHSTSAEHCDTHLTQIASTLGPGLDSLQAAIIERLRDGLQDDEVDLCRRLSLVIGPFPRRVGEHLWALDRNKIAFHKPWNGCVASVFESHSFGRYCLPDLYRDGLRREADEDDAKVWHGAIADAFAELDGSSADIHDIHVAVVHRFLSGDLAAALASASMYLAFARGPYARTAQAFLISRFELWLADSARDPSVPASQRIGWHAIRTRVYADLDLNDKAEIASRDLHDLLCAEPSDAAPEALQLGWVSLLTHASTTGQPDLALSAISHIRRAYSS